MTRAAVTSITNFLLAGEVLFLAGLTVAIPKRRFSAAWYWSGVLLLLGLGALIGGIDHGFFEAAGLPRYAIQRATWIVLGAMTFCLLMSAAAQFFAPGAERLLLIVALVQFAANTVVVLASDSFLAVVLNYAPVLLFVLAMHIRGPGSRAMIAGILVMAAAAAIQAAGIDTFSPLDHNGLYHLTCMLAAVFLYAAGLRLKTS